MSSWNYKLSVIEDMLYRREYPTLEFLAEELGETTRNVRRHLAALREKGRQVAFDRLRGGYCFECEPTLPLMVEEGYAGPLETHVTVAYALEHGLVINLVTAVTHIAYRVIPLEITRRGTVAVLRAATLPSARLVEFPLNRVIIATAERFDGDWEAIRHRAIANCDKNIV